jgi:predicted ABC-type transport system involved in lysophospholipase L1 biosynthesis ATPase subunit
MADEPTGNLDTVTAESITDLLLELQRQADPPTMMIVVTHSEALAKRMQRCMRLESGQLMPVGHSTIVD